MTRFASSYPFAFLITLVLMLPCPALAQQSVPAPAIKTDKPKRVLTPEEKQEKAQRHTCKVQICSIFSTQDPAGDDIDCPIIKTWRESDIEDILSGGTMDWPWGKARCTTQLKLNRAMLAAAAGEGETVAALDTHTVACALDLKSEGENYEVKVDIAPVVTFKNGKAVAGQINWGRIDAPILAYSAIWPGAKLDNSLNVLQGTLVKMVNEFMGRKCAQVKDELPMRASFSPPAN